MSIFSRIFNKTARQANFSISPVRLPSHSKFDVPYSHKTTMKEGDLVPLYWDYTIPGDVLSVDSSIVLRFNDLLRPFMDELYIEQFWFFVPFRLIWDHWTNFFGAKESPAYSTNYVVPVAELRKGDNALKPQGLVNYFVGIDGNQLDNNGVFKFHAFLPRAYNLIFSDWFLPAEIVNRPGLPKGDGPDDLNISSFNYGNPWRIMKTHDYFTTALPSPQNGPAVMLPLAGSAPVDVYGDGKALTLDGGRRSGGGYPILGKMSTMLSDVGNYDAEFNIRGSYGGTGATSDMYNLGPVGNYSTVYPQLLTANPGSTLPDGAGGQMGVPTKDIIAKYNSSATYPITSGLTGEADLSAATSISIQQFRELVAINQLLEKDIYYGMRYTELLMAHFGVHNGDLSLQRSQFLGKSKQKISLVQVPQTSSSTNLSPQGSLSAYAMQNAFGHMPRTSFGECGVVMCLVAIRQSLNYQQGINRHLFKKTRFDFFWPEFQGLSDQPVYQGELYFRGIDDQDKITFGYQTRYAEYKYKPNNISGWLNSMADTPMDMWHLAQKFTSAPVLNYSFLVENAPINRVRAVIDENYNAPFLIDSLFTSHWMRPMTLDRLPGLGKI